MFYTWMLVALAGCVAAQISAGCKKALLSVTDNTNATACLSPTTLTPLLAGTYNSSVLAVVDTWITNMCAASPCSDDTLAAAVKNITTGCAADGNVSSALLENIHNAQFIYPTVRKVLCLKDSGKNCFTQTLTNVQISLGNDTSITNVSDSNVGYLFANLGSFIQKIGSSTQTRAVRFGRRSTNQTQSSQGQMPANLTCTNCIKMATQIINNDLPGSMNRIFPDIEEFCGVEFSNNTQPGPVKAAGTRSSAVGSSLSNGIYFGTLITTIVIMTISCDPRL